jgi:hypothetical protein
MIDSIDPSHYTVADQWANDEDFAALVCHNARECRDAQCHSAEPGRGRRQPAPELAVPLLRVR